MTFSVSAPTNNTGALLNNGTEVLSIDSNNNIGIGTTSPTGLLELNGGNLVLDHTTPQTIYKVSGTEKGYARLNNDVYEVNSLSGYNFKVNGFNKMSMDSNGYVTKPNQPAFAVGASAAANPAATTAGNNIIWNVVYLNRNNVVNTTNGRFTAPISGSYFISFHSIAGANGANAQNDVQFRINGTRYMDSREQGHSTYWESISMNVVVDLNANDYVETYVNVGEIYSNNQNWAKFSGFLIG